MQGPSAIEVVGATLEEARLLVSVATPSGCEVASREEIAPYDGEASARGETQTIAFTEAEKTIPGRAEILDRRVVDPGRDRRVMVSARDAQAAREAVPCLPHERITGVELVQAGRRRLLGLLAPKSTFRVAVRGQVEVAVRFHAPARIRIHTQRRSLRWRTLLDRAGDGFGLPSEDERAAHDDLIRACADPKAQQEILACVREQFKYDSRVRRLLRYGGARVVPELLAVFADCGPYGGLQDQIVLFIHRVSRGSLRQLAPMLKDRYSPTVRVAAKALGLAECCEDELLAAGCGVNSGPVIEGLREAGTQFAKTLAELLQGNERDKVKAMGLETKSTADLVHMLRRIAGRWASNEDNYAELTMPARAIGEELYRRGGMSSMREAHASVGAGGSTLEMMWDGVGDWRG